MTNLFTFISMRILIITLLLLGPFILMAQEDQPLQKWKDSSLHDSVRYEAINTVIWELFFSIPD
ncbi:MAG: hypothetical protein JKY54_01750 [Flavobacteriales bacterium]|nr:hypothetical protein [Flavobacteriales bacterium]